MFCVLHCISLPGIPKFCIITSMTRSSGHPAGDVGIVRAVSPLRLSPRPEHWTYETITPWHRVTRVVWIKWHPITIMTQPSLTKLHLTRKKEVLDLSLTTIPQTVEHVKRNISKWHFLWGKNVLLHSPASLCRMSWDFYAALDILSCRRHIIWTPSPVIWNVHDGVSNWLHQLKATLFYWPLLFFSTHILSWCFINTGRVSTWAHCSEHRLRASLATSLSPCRRHSGQNQYVICEVASWNNFDKYLYSGHEIDISI